jgi:molecular chaperone GrpE
LIATASASVLKDLLSVLDDFDRAIANNTTVTDSEAIKEGFNLIHTKLKTTLENKGLKAMTAKGEAFDPEIHEAIANIPAPSEEMKGKVIDDVEAGYYLNDKVIRFAKVVVGN